MVMKKLSILAVFLFLMILFLGVASAADSCIIKDRDFCDEEDMVIGLFDLTNSHGELWDEINYDNVLCCDLEYQLGYERRGRECSDHLHPVYGDSVFANKVIGLSSATNAHAEVTQESNYVTNQICYENLACISTEENCGPDYSMEVLSLSDSTNAHIGGFDNYNICCKQIECRVEVSFCSHYDRSDECDYDPCKDKDVAETSVNENAPPGVICGEGYNCFCEWDNATDKCGPRWDAIIEPECGDEKIDPGEDCDGTALPFIECSGNVGSCTGGVISCYPPGHEKECTWNVSRCTGCLTGGFCGDNLIQSPNDGGVDETCDNESLNSKTCVDFNLLNGDLACHPPEYAKNCTFDTAGCMPLETHPSKIGKCNYDENTDDNCDDRFLTYNWTATWTWNSENNGSAQPCKDDYLLDDGKCYYDPNEASKKCVGGSNTVPCPAQIQLPFFGSYSVIIIIALIILIYIFLTLKKKGKKSKIFRLFSKK